MPQDLFKWEEGGGLKHHCPICQTPLSHDKCKTVCLGNHVEWCHRYHTLFRKNWSRRCNACKTADEQHEKRHREIAEILARVRELKVKEEAAALQLLTSSSTPKTPRVSPMAKAQRAVDSPLSVTNEIPKNKKERKAAKKAAKALERDKVVTASDIQAVAKALHPQGEKASDILENEPDTEVLEESTEIYMNLKYNNSTCNSKSARHDFIIRDREREEVDESEIARILKLLDVNRNATGANGELIKELIAIIKRDLMSFRDELKTIKRTRAGFWRWATKRAYHDLVENGKEWDARNQWNYETPSQCQHGNGMLQQTNTEDEQSRNSSIVSSEAESAVAAWPVPSDQPGRPAPKKAGAPPKKLQENPNTDDWTQVGQEVLKPAVGKLMLLSNSGLHHLNSKTKGECGALVLPKPAPGQSGPRPVENLVVDSNWQRFRLKN